MKKVFSYVFCFLIAVNLTACNIHETELDVIPWYKLDPSPQEIPPSVVYTGNGNDIISIDKVEPRYVIYIEGNEESDLFSVKGYDENDNITEVFVATSCPYQGVSVDPTQKTTKLKIHAKGNWKVESRSVYTLPTISEGESLKGTGDAVIWVKSYGLLASIKGNALEKYFEVKSFGELGDYIMVSTTKQYSDTVELKGEPFALTIKAAGDWEISFDEIGK